MKPKIVAIGVLADRLDILECQGERVLSSRRVPVTVDSNPTDPLGWAKSVRAAASLLKDVVEEMGLVGRRAYVVYRSPTETADYVSLKLSSSAQAREAALLGCSDKLGFPVDQAVVDAAVIGRDAASADMRQTHLVVTAERDDHATALATLVTDAGLKFVSATPVDAAVMARLAGGALKRRAPGEHTGLLYIGERRSFFLIVNDGSLVFARPIGLGIEALVTSLTRPLRAMDGQAPVELNVETARAILHKFGFPKREEIVHPELGVTGGQLIPLLQPVLQRYIVELRQSLRFGLPEEERQSVTVQFTGPGSSIPGFAELVSKELGLKIDIDPKYAEFDGVQVGAAGSELVDAVADVSLLSKLNLQPRAIARRVEAKRFRRFLWTGAAAALAWVATDAFQSQSRVADLRRETESLTARAEELQSMQVAGKKLMEAIDAMKLLDTTIASEMGSTVNFRAALFEISKIVPTSVRLTDIKFTSTDGRTVGSIAGYAYQDESAGRKTQLESFISQLRTSPLFDDVSLHNVQMSDTKIAAAQTFEVSLICVTGPGKDSPLTTVAAATEVSRP